MMRSARVGHSCAHADAPVPATNAPAKLNIRRLVKFIGERPDPGEVDLLRA